MTFRLFGVPVRIRFMFWATALLLGIGYRSAALLGTWVAVVFLSVIVHELGHALCARAFGGSPSIELVAFGGETTTQALPRWRHLVMAASGPLASFALGLVALLAYRLMAPSGLVKEVFRQVFMTTFGWGILNLVPVWPLDGGQVLRDLLGPTRERATFIISAFVAGALAALMIRFEILFGGILFAVMCLRSVQAVVAYPEMQARVRAAEDIAARGVATAEESLAKGDDEDAELRALTSLPLAATPALRDRARRVLVAVNLRRDDGARALTVLSTMESPVGDDDVGRAQALDLVGRRDEAFSLLESRAVVEPQGPALGALLRGLLATDQVDHALEVAGKVALTASRDALAFLLEELKSRHDAARVHALAAQLKKRGDFAVDAFEV